MSERIIVQGQKELTSDPEGLTVPCPFCEENEEVKWTPKPYLKSGKCYYCNREFDVIVRWEE